MAKQPLETEPAKPTLSPAEAYKEGYLAAKADGSITGPHVFHAIAQVAGELSIDGVQKNRKNTQGSGYNFRGIDDIYNAMAPLLSKHRLVIVPRVLEREQVERASKSGGALFYTTVKVEFDFISAVDGSKHTACTYGEAMDSGDKSTNKAMSAAYKYVAFQAFCIPTEGDNDADSQTHEVKSKEPAEMKITPLKRATEATDDYIKRICQSSTVEAVGLVMKEVDDKGTLEKMFPDLYQSIVDEYQAHLDMLSRKEK